MERAYYSVPFKLIHAHVEVRVTDTSIEVFHRGQRVAAHARAHRRGEFVTAPGHRPDGHQAIIEQSHARLLERAAAIGPATADLIRLQATLKRHPEQTLRSTLGILRLAADFSPAELERACARAVTLKTYSYRTLRALLTAAPVSAVPPARLPAHGNLRGPDYFQ